MEILGKVKKIFDIQIFENGFKKRELILTTDEQYSQNILIEFIQDRTHLLDTLILNDLVKISINLRGREWINSDGVIKYFTSIQGWRIEKMPLKKTYSADTLDPIPPISRVDMHASENEFDDLPF